MTKVTFSTRESLIDFFDTHIDDSRNDFSRFRFGDHPDSPKTLNFQEAQNFLSHPDDLGLLNEEGLYELNYA